MILGVYIMKGYVRIPSLKINNTGKDMCKTRWHKVNWKLNYHVGENLVSYIHWCCISIGRLSVPEQILVIGSVLVDRFTFNIVLKINCSLVMGNILGTTYNHKQLAPL